jgi:hypothetical protein
MLYIAVPENWDDQRLNLIEKIVKTKMYEPKSVEVTGGWRKCYKVNETGRTGKQEMDISLLLESLEEADNLILQK